MFAELDIARLKFIMTMSCNFRCDYCFEGGKSNNHLTSQQCIELGKQVIQEMKQKDLTILYFGGEPMLRFPEMKEVTPVLKMFADKNEKQLAVSVITNGTIMSPEILRHLIAYRYRVSISCDGIAPAQNSNRGYLNGSKNSFDRVNDTIDRLLFAGSQDLCISMVVTKQNVKYLGESVQWALEKGIRNFTISPVTNDFRFSPDPISYKEELYKIANLLAPLDPVVCNPPLDKQWDINNTTRRMVRSDVSVNVELSPIGLNIIPEQHLIKSVDFSLQGDSGLVTPVPEAIRLQIVEAEREVSKHYLDLRRSFRV